MAIYQTNKGYGVDYRDEFGRRHRKHVGEKGAAELLEKHLTASGQQARRALTQYRRAESLDLDAARDLFIAACGQSAVTREKTRLRLNLFIRKVGNLQVAQVTPSLLDDWHNARKQQLSPGTLAAEAILLRRWFRFLCNEWHLPHSPAEGLPCTYPRASAGNPLTYEEEAKLLEQIHTPTMWLRYCLGTDAGLRNGEMFTLRNGRVDMTGKQITAFPSKKGQPRTIPMTPRLHAAFIEYCDPRNCDPDSPIFKTRKGAVKHAWKPLPLLQTTPGVARRRFHDLRHTFATRLASIRTPAHVIRALLGHVPVFSLDLYTHASEEEKREAIAKLATHNREQLRAIANRPQATDPNQPKATDKNISKELT